MRPRFSVFSKWFQDLANGDTVAWTVFGMFALFAVGFGLFSLKILRDLKKEDDSFSKRYGRKPE